MFKILDCLFFLDLHHLNTFAFQQVVVTDSRKSPFILFMKDVEKSIAGNLDASSAFKSKVEQLPDNIVVIGSHTHTDSRKEKVTSV